MPRRLSLCLTALLALAAAEAPRAAAQPATQVQAPDPAWFVGAWRGEVPDPVRGTAVIELLLGDDGHYQRSYRPQAYFGMVYDTGTWVSANGALQLRWTEYTVIPKPAYPPLQQGTDTYVVEAPDANTMRFRSPACTAPQCWAQLERVQ